MSCTHLYIFKIKIWGFPSTHPRNIGFHHIFRSKFRIFLCDNGTGLFRELGFHASCNVYVFSHELYGENLVAEKEIRNISFLYKIYAIRVSYCCKINRIKISIQSRFNVIKYNIIKVDYFLERVCPCRSGSYFW